MAATGIALSEPEISTPQASVVALTRQLDGLVTCLLTLEADIYVARAAASVTGSIGEHVRHLLDHVAALVSADPSRPLSYDHRERGTAIESDISAALRQALRLKAALERWMSRALDDPLLVQSVVSASGDRVDGWSTLSREVAFVLSHTIHHLASIALLLYIQGLVVPDRFGFAPTTPTLAPPSEDA